MPPDPGPATAYGLRKGPLTVQIGYKVLPGESFASQDECAHAYFGAENKPLAYTLV
jgi:hypothetical protein